MSRETEPLTPEERAFAQRLARLSAQAEPSPSLDARILAAAHAAATPRAARKRRHRWPALLGYAATAAIACGIAWQLRPLPNRPMATSAADASTYEEPLAEVAASPPPMQARTVPPRPLNMPEPPPAEPPPARPQRRNDIRSASAADATEKPQAFEPIFEIDEAVPAHPGTEVAGARANAAAVAAPPPAAAAPAAPPALARQREEAAAAKAQASDARTLDSATVRDEPESAEADEEVVPPATADSPAVREAWFTRIRELLRAGKTDEARASLREFRHRYPRQPLPDDLRALDVE